MESLSLGTVSQQVLVPAGQELSWAKASEISDLKHITDHEVMQGCQGQEACHTPHNAGGTWYSPENRNSTSPWAAWAPPCMGSFLGCGGSLRWGAQNQHQHLALQLLHLFFQETVRAKNTGENFLLSSVSDFSCTCFHPCFPWWETSKIFLI